MGIIIANQSQILYYAEGYTYIHTHIHTIMGAAHKIPIHVDGTYIDAPNITVMGRPLPVTIIAETVYETYHLTFTNTMEQSAEIVIIVAPLQTMASSVTDRAAAYPHGKKWVFGVSASAEKSLSGPIVGGPHIGVAQQEVFDHVGTSTDIPRSVVKHIISLIRGKSIDITIA